MIKRHKEMLYINQAKSMSAKLISIEGKKVKIEVTIELNDSMLDSEKLIQEKLNEAVCIATKEALKQQDTDGNHD